MILQECQYRSSGLNQSGVLLCVVDVEEIRVQHRLHNACNDRDRVEVALRKVPVYPVRNVQRSVRAKSEDVMRRDVLCLACPLQHKQLRQNSDRFKPY